EDDLAHTRAAIENWYNDAMDRVAGWYKRKCQAILLCLAVLVACISNTDSILVARTLWSNPELRASTVAAAQSYVSANQAHDNTATPDASQQAQIRFDKVKAINEKLQTLQLPIGWPGSKEIGDYNRNFPDDSFHIFYRLFGWFLTAIALSL